MDNGKTLNEMARTNLDNIVDQEIVFSTALYAGHRRNLRTNIQERLGRLRVVTHVRRHTFTDTGNKIQKENIIAKCGGGWCSEEGNPALQSRAPEGITIYMTISNADLKSPVQNQQVKI